MLRKNIHLLAVCLLLVSMQGFSQAKHYPIDPSDKNGWVAYNREAKSAGTDKVELNAADADGLFVLQTLNFSSGTIEFDVKGEDKMNASFVGLAFHVQDNKQFEAVYFRPFNFFNADTARRWHSVQYIYSPDYPWQKLRELFPGKYENKLQSPPNPNEWFHVKLVIKPDLVQAFLNNSAEPCLQVKPISTLTGGKLGFWVGNGSMGTFSNLIVTGK